MPRTSPQLPRPVQPACDLGRLSAAGYSGGREVEATAGWAALCSNKLPDRWIKPSNRRPLHRMDPPRDSDIRHTDTQGLQKRWYFESDVQSPAWRKFLLTNFVRGRRQAVSIKWTDIRNRRFCWWCIMSIWMIIMIMLNVEEPPF